MAQPKFSDAFTFIPQGGIIQEFRVGGRNIVLSFPSASSYKDDASPYFGANIGRVANRISNAKIDRLNGKSYQLVANNGPNTLHGGPRGWDKRDFEGPMTTTRNGKQAILFKYLSKDGEEGFPGTVEMKLWYTPSVEQDEGKDKTSLEIEYEAELVGGEVEETAVSLTNHSYFNITDGPTIEGTKAIVYTNLYQPTNSDDIPLGTIEPYPEFEANREFVFGAEKPDPDHCFIMNPNPSSIPLDTRGLPMKKLVYLSHPTTKIHFEALSTEPAFQLYAGRFINVPAMDGQPARGQRAGLCIEASRYVNAINHDEWRQQVVLKKGEIWGSRTIYRSWIE